MISCTNPVMEGCLVISRIFGECLTLCSAVSSREMCHLFFMIFRNFLQIS